MRVLDLFSGIGGFSLGLERTGGFQTAAFCEIEPFCQNVLRKHWPDVPIYDDVRGLSRDRLDADGIGGIDVICGGFPCQPFSTASAGKQRGSEDDRWLWPEMLRVTSDLRPRWVIGENVAGFDRMELESMVSDLEGVGYQVGPPLEIPACAVEQDHRRARVWICAYTDSNSKYGSSVHEKVAELPGIRQRPLHPRAANGLSGRLDGHRRRAIGNSVVPQIPEMIGRAILEAESMEAAA